MSNLIDDFNAARLVSTPLIAVRTPDPAATIEAISMLKSPDPQNTDAAVPLISWDIVRGISALNKVAQPVVAKICGEREPSMFNNPTEALAVMSVCPKTTIVFMHNAHRYVQSEAAVAQAVWNLRDEFKLDYRALVMLCPSITLPSELQADVLVLDEPLPSYDELCRIVGDQYAAAQLDMPSCEIMTKATDAICGLAAFPAEQVTAMSLTRKGLNLDALWERKREMIEQTPGLSVWRGGETFDDIAGIENAKTFGRRVLSGRNAPRAIVFIDEIEKALAGAGGDLSGTSQEMLGTLLTYMQDTQAAGVICVGPPGAAKSMFAKACGGTAGVPTIAFDLSGMKGSLVGESGANLRNALKVVSAVSQGRTLFIATCNAIASLPPELRRRFTFGTFFFDLPTEEEQLAIWKLYIKKYGLEAESRKMPNFEGWTGAEIKQCCDLAWRLKCSLTDASAYIVPVARSNAEQINRLRNEASGRFISASEPGVYSFDKIAPPSVARKLRAISQGEA